MTYVNSYQRFLKSIGNKLGEFSTVSHHTAVLDKDKKKEIFVKLLGTFT